jgi:hypothetical protein
MTFAGRSRRACGAFAIALESCWVCAVLLLTALAVVLALLGAPA